MDIELEIYSLHAETLALQTIITTLCQNLARESTALRSAITRSFDLSANFIEDRAIKHDKTARPEHLVKALRIVEEIRASVLGNPDDPTNLIDL